jgi:Fe-Mn family superoxide dismutase
MPDPSLLQRIVLRHLGHPVKKVASEPGKHTLPDLPYAYDALEPQIDAETMELHHTKHQQSYVDGLNSTEIALQEARNSGDYSAVPDLHMKLAFHGAGHFNHCLFWVCMTPAEDQPEVPEVLLTQIEEDFGSLENMLAEFKAGAEKVEGNGWAMLVWDPMSDKLRVMSLENHQKNYIPGCLPILALDVWEHAYYLTYRNRRGDYVDSFFEVINWNAVAGHLEIAKGNQNLLRGKS